MNVTMRRSMEAVWSFESFTVFDEAEAGAVGDMMRRSPASRHKTLLRVEGSTVMVN